MSDFFLDQNGTWKKVGHGFSAYAFLELHTEVVSSEIAIGFDVTIQPGSHPCMAAQMM